MLCIPLEVKAWPCGFVNMFRNIKCILIFSIKCFDDPQDQFSNGSVLKWVQNALFLHIQWVSIFVPAYDDQIF